MLASLLEILQETLLQETAAALGVVAVTLQISKAILNAVGLY